MRFPMGVVANGVGHLSGIFMETDAKKKPKITVDLAYLQCGSGPDVVGISGFGCAGWLLQPLADVMGQHVRLWLPDHRGMGRSPPGDDMDYDLDDMARDVLALIQTRIGHPVAIFGVSMGGFIVQRLLALAPAWITRAAILCSTSGGPRFRPLFTFWGAAQMEKVLAMDPLAYARWILEPPVSPCLARYPETYDFLLQKRLDNPENALQVMSQYHAMAQFFQDAQDLSSITIPVWVGCGERDPVFPAANSRLLAASLPRGSLTFFPETDHLFFCEQSTEVGHALLNFFLSP
ncbi:MAG: alpha/beta hydrolase [Magnetococcales bacterium]|nr:alpha/beta hydrolase [Magnetococcales bacterium]